MNKVILLCDCDGTLVPLYSRPGDTVIPVELLNLMAKLIAHPQLQVGVISGRTPQDLLRFFSLSGIYLAALHGGVILYPDGQTEWLVNRPSPELLTKLHSIALEVKAGHAGVFLEPKELGIALHYRLAKEGTIIAQEFQQRVQSLLEPTGLEILHGKEVIEIRPQGVNKGVAVRRLMQNRRGTTPVYIGDDLTDEDAFREVIKMGGIGILVGQKNNSAASNYLPDVAAVWQFLDELSQDINCLDRIPSLPNSSQPPTEH